MSLNFSPKDLQYFDQGSWFTYGYAINSYTDLGLAVGKVSKPIMPQVQESTQDIPGMYGDVYMGNDYGEMTFTIPVTLLAFDQTSFDIICSNLRATFTQDQNAAGVEYPIQFSDRPDVKYYGHWGQMSDPQFLTPNDWQASATLTFICSQPYGYLDQSNIEVDYPDQPIIPKGNAKTYPIYQIYLKQDVYNIGFESPMAGDEYVATGYQVDDNNTDDEGNKITDSEPLDTCEEPTTLNDWIANGTENKQIMTFQLDGDQAGQMGERDGGGITPAPVIHVDKNRPAGQQNVQTLNYGLAKNHKGWYGPLAIHPQFNNPTPDWRIMVNLWNRKTSTDHSSDRAMGHCDILLLDQNGHRKGRIYIHDWQKGEMPRVGFALGDSDDNEVQMINNNSTGSHSAIGPQKIGNYNYRRNRSTPSNGFIITSLYAYKQAVSAAKKTNNKKVKKQNKQNRITNATTKRQKEVAQRDDGQGRHVHHHYKKGRKRRRR